MYCGHHDVAGNHGANGVDDNSGSVEYKSVGGMNAKLRYSVPVALAPNGADSWDRHF